MLKMPLYDFVLLGLWETATIAYSVNHIDLKISRYSRTLNVSYIQTNGKKAGFNVTLINRFQGQDNINRFNRKYWITPQ